MSEPIKIYSDGACRGNPGAGGWGVLLIFKHNKKELYGAVANTTNNRMELMAAIMGLESLTRACNVIVTTDSNYVKNGITAWIKNWKKKDWQTANKSPVKNQDLWQRLDVACKPHTVKWEWVKGHSGHDETERADQLANKAINEFLT